MEALLAGTPIAVVLVLMVGRRWPASRAGAVGAAVALAIGVGVFGLGRGAPEGSVGAGAIVATVGEALFTSATILWIVLPALAIHHLQVATGATERLRVALAGLATDPRILALLIGCCFALFIEGAAGFGASVALAAPFLVGVGYRPLDAVVVAMLGHAIGVSFGAVGTPIVPQVAATGLPAVAIAGATATLHLVVGGLLLAAAVWVASRATGLPARGAIWGWTALTAVAFLVPYWAIASFVGPELPTLVGSLTAAGVLVAALRLRGRRFEPGRIPAVVDAPDLATPPFERDVAAASAEAAEVADHHAVAPHVSTAPPRPGELLRAGAPYLVLIAAVLLTRLVTPIAETLGALEVAWQAPGGFGGSFRPLVHPGTLLAVSFLVGAAVQRVGAPAVLAAVRTTLAQLGAVTVALVAMLTLARTTVHAGMTAELAQAAAGAAGGAWPALAPLVGVLGTFVTGSATASNVLFTDLQVGAAEAVGADVLPVVAGQGYGAAVGNVVCPHNVVAAGATVGLTGGEGDVLRRTLAPALIYAALGGLVALTLW